MKRWRIALPFVPIVLIGVVLLGRPRTVGGDPAGEAKKSAAGFDGVISGNSNRMLEEGRKIFRFETFGSQAF
jgi:hypothetical protein